MSMQQGISCGEPVGMVTQSVKGGSYRPPAPVVQRRMEMEISIRHFPHRISITTRMRMMPLRWRSCPIDRVKYPAFRRARRYRCEPIGLQAVSSFGTHQAANIDHGPPIQTSFRKDRMNSGGRP